MTSWYVPRPVYQLDGSACAGANCWSASGCSALDGATGGAAIITPTVFRQRAGGGSGRANKPGCPSGFEVDVVKGLSAMGVRARIIRVTEKSARSRLSTDRPAMFVIATDYELWPKAQKGAAPGFDGNHMVALLPGTDKQGRVRVLNPLARDIQKVDIDAVMAATLKFARDHGRGSTIWMVRSVRPAVVPTGATPAEKALAKAEARIAELEDVLDDAHDAAAALVLSLGPYDQED